MAGEMEALFSLAGRMHVLLRREHNRIVDVEWMCADAAYANETVRLAYDSASDELHKLAQRFSELHPLLGGIEPPVMHAAMAAEPKYVATLR